jgi:hypothetical protein
MRINQPELEPRPNDVTHGVPYQEDGVLLIEKCIKVKND